MIRPEQDYWQASGELIQPKAQIASYVESEGIATPKRFDTLEETLSVVRAGGTILLRSEHPDEYDGPSGLLDSKVVNLLNIARGKERMKRYGNIDLDESIPDSLNRPWGSFNPKSPGGSEIERGVIGEILDTDPSITMDRLTMLRTGQRHAKTYAQLTGQSIDNFVENSSFSFWEYVPGTNIAVVADDAIEGQYHVLTSSRRRDRKVDGLPLPEGSSGFVSDGNGNVLQIADDIGLQLSPDKIRKILEQYEAVRNLGRFAKNHCPIMEFQISHNEELLFLQYHRSRDANPATETLNPEDYDARDGWLKAVTVRGQIASPARLMTMLGYPKNYGISGSGSFFPKIPDSIDAKLGQEINSVQDELVARRLKAALIGSDFDWLYPDIASQHSSRSFWFKPQVSLAYGRGDADLDKIVPLEMFKDGYDAIRAGLVARIAMEVASDGKTGYIRRDPSVDEVEYDFGTAIQKP